MAAPHYALSLTWMPETFHAQFLFFRSFRLQLNVCQLTPINKKKPLVPTGLSIRAGSRPKQKAS